MIKIIYNTCHPHTGYNSKRIKIFKNFNDYIKWKDDIEDSYLLEIYHIERHYKDRIFRRW